MRLGIAGKGGAGKTTIAASVARLAAERGVPVVAVDADSNPNLAAALGVDPAATARLSALPASIVSRRLDGPALREPLAKVLDEHSVRGPAGVRVSLMGAPTHVDEGCLCSAHATVSAFLAASVDEPGSLTVLDLEASPEHFSRGTARHVDTLLLVTEAYYRSLETVRRMAQLADELPVTRIGVLANKLRSPADHDAIAAFCEHHELELVGSVPWSDDVIDADLAGIPLVDHAPGSASVAALTGLLASLLDPAWLADGASRS